MSEFLSWSPDDRLFSDKRAPFRKGDLKFLAKIYGRALWITMIPLIIPLILSLDNGSWNIAINNTSNNVVTSILDTLQNTPNETNTHAHLPENCSNDLWGGCW